MPGPNTLPKPPKQEPSVIIHDATDTIDIERQIAPKGGRPKESQPQDTGSEDTADTKNDMTHVEEFASFIPSNNRQLFLRVLEEVKKADILNFLLFGKADFPFKIGPVSVNYNIIDAGRKYHIDQYLYAMDPLKLFENEDHAMIESYMKDLSMTKSEATRYFQNEFKVDMARKRYTLVLLAEAIKTVNGKSLGTSTRERLETIGSFSVVLLDQLANIYELIELATKCLLTDPDYLKN
jgi:hypothetical protein